MEKKKRERICKIIKEMTRIDFYVKRGLLNSTKVCFKERMKRREREKIDKCLKEDKIKKIWGDRCLIVK